MTVSTQESNIVHFHPVRVPQTECEFYFANCKIGKVSGYTYLGVLLTEHLDFNQTVKVVAQSANRALGSIIAKYKTIVCTCMSYDVYKRTI